MYTRELNDARKKNDSLAEEREALTDEKNKKQSEFAELEEKIMVATINGCSALKAQLIKSRFCL